MPTELMTTIPHFTDRKRFVIRYTFVSRDGRTVESHRTLYASCQKEAEYDAESSKFPTETILTVEQTESDRRFFATAGGQ